MPNAYDSEETEFAAARSSLAFLATVWDSETPSSSSPMQTILAQNSGVATEYIGAIV